MTTFIFSFDKMIKLGISACVVSTSNLLRIVPRDESSINLDVSNCGCQKVFLTVIHITTFTVLVQNLQRT